MHYPKIASNHVYGYTSTIDTGQNNSTIITAHLNSMAKFTVYSTLVVCSLIYIALIVVLLLLSLHPRTGSEILTDILISIPLLGVLTYLLIKNAMVPYLTTIDTTTGLVSTTGLLGKRQVLLADIVSSKNIYMIYHGPYTSYSSPRDGLKLKSRTGRTLYLAVNLFNPETKAAVIAYCGQCNVSSISLNISKLNISEGYI